jgi:hypothetical protein
MADLDLDILNNKPETLTLKGTKYEFKDLEFGEHLRNEFRIKELDAIPLINEEAVKQASELKNEYLLNLLDIPEEIVSQITIKEFKKIREFLERKELYDQGFTDKDIDLIEKKQVKNLISQK